jgi:hypothetical protein
MAATLKKYVVPSVSPVTVQLVAVNVVGQPAALAYVPVALVETCT